MFFTARFSDGSMFCWLAFDNEQAVEMSKDEATRRGVELVSVSISADPLGSETRIF